MGDIDSRVWVRIDIFFSVRESLVEKYVKVLINEKPHYKDSIMVFDELV